MLETHAGRLDGQGLVAWGLAWLRAGVRRPAWLRRTTAAIAAGAPVEPGERVLTAVREVSGAPVVATGHAVYYQDRAAVGHSWSRLGWEDVDRILWDDGSCALTLTRLRDTGPLRVVLRLARHAPLVELASERVTSTTVATAPVLSGGRVCGQLTARRRTGSDQVRWVFTLRDRTASGDPALGSRVSGAIAALEAELGLVSRRPARTPEGWPRS